MLTAATALTHPLLAQRGGFVATLGTDTVHIERFVRSGNSIEGTIVTRTPRTRLVRYTADLDAQGRLVRYVVATTEADGAPVRTTGTEGSLKFGSDTIVRETLKNGQPDTQRIAAPFGAVPSPSIPYIEVSYLMYEMAFAEARTRTSATTELAIYQLTMIPSQLTPQRTRVWFIGADSAEVDYFGVARSGWRFDAKGQLLRADWTGTTYRYRIRRTEEPNVEEIARAWAVADARGAGMGALSPRDTTRAHLAAAELTIDYSRPSKRGRVIWGDVVPWDQVWRLGADMATHFTTTRDLRIGAVDLPAGTYTLWMLLSRTGATQLVINRQTNVWGTAYNPAADLARVPMQRSAISAPVERLTIEVTSGALWIRWDNVAWSVPVVVR
jgi:hypothetical protein